MHKSSRIRFALFCSDNRKSKIQNRKWVGLFAILVAFTICGTRAEAQQPAKIPRIGYVSISGTATCDRSFGALRQGLRDLGYSEGKNILFEYRGAEGKRDRIPGLAAELVQLKVDVLFCPNLPAIDAAKQATNTIPIIMVSNVDPVELGFVASLALPGGHIAGVANLTPELAGKRLELHKEVVPQVSRVAVLWNPDNLVPGLRMRETEAAANSLVRLPASRGKGGDDL